MIERFVDRFIERQSETKALLVKNPPENYLELVKIAINAIANRDDDFAVDPDPEIIHELDYGDYQGTLVFIVGCQDYQTDTCWYVKVSYGSCSGCDTLQSIIEREDFLDKDGIESFWTLALHIIQGLKEMDGESV